jgi:hypothetical protein
MKYYKISDEFAALNEFIVNLPVAFDHTGLIIKDNRNVIRKVDTAQGTLVIKSFKGMYFFNRVAYSFFRKSKAERSYLNSASLNEKGIFTPPNVGWLDTYRWKLLEKSYYICLYSPHKTFQEHLVDHANDENYKKTLYAHLLTFVIKLHRAGINQMDLSLGNILVIPTTDGYEFSMVDLNRVRFHKMSFRQGLNNLRKIEIPLDDLNNLIREYAVQNGQSPEAAVAMYWADTQRFIFLRSLRKQLRKYTLTPVEKLVKRIFSRSKQH